MNLIIIEYIKPFMTRSNKIPHSVDLQLVFKRTFLLAEQFGHFRAEQFGSVFGRTSIFYELFYEHFQKGAKVDIAGFFKSLHKK